MSLRVLALPRYGPAGPSSRYRFYQFVDALSTVGIDIHVDPLLPNAYVERLYAGKKAPVASVMTGYIRRVLRLMGVNRFDVVWLEGELFPWLPAWLERSLRTPYVVDYDDAIFHRYDMHRNPAVRYVLGGKIDAVMRSAAVVVAGNEYLAERARAAGARRVSIIPTVLDPSRYRTPDDVAMADAPFTIGWIGSPSTEVYLRAIAEALPVLQGRAAVRFLAVGASPSLVIDRVAIEVVPWTSEGEARLLASIDVGVMPLTDDPWSRGKCGFKLIQYMAAGRPVVASPVGANRSIVIHGETGFLANSRDEWIAALDHLRLDPQLRARMGGAGRRRVEQHYSVQSALPEIVHALHWAAKRGRP